MIVLLVLLGAGAILTQLRWLRVAQREHYLVGCASRFALRWWRSSPLNAVALVILVLFGIGSFTDPLFSFGVVVLSAVAPIGLTIRGRTSKLAWTRRLRLLAGVVAVLSVVPVLLAALVASTRDAVSVGVVLVVFAPVVTDLALWLVSPIEARLGDRYVAQASRRLERVAPTVVAITGSYGKTSTKGYVAHLLNDRHVVVASPRSFNNRAGLARTINEHLLPGTEILVAEMGTYGRGEIAEMCRWMHPSISVITAIGPVHLERFGDLSNTLAAKAEITETAVDVVLNIDDVRLRSLVDQLVDSGKRVVACSARDIDADVCVRLEGKEIVLYRRGTPVAHQVLLSGQVPTALTNVACALGVALVLGDPLEDLAIQIASLPQPPNRLTETTGETGVHIFDDTFNSNPAGASLALDRLAESGNASGRRVLVTPGMVELGQVQVVENRRLSARASTICSDIVIVGRTNLRALRSGVASGVKLILATDRDEAVAWVKSNLSGEDTVLYENDLPDHYA